MDPERATRAAARHLHDLYNEFGDWYLALAAYNCGPGVVEKAVERTGFADFWELRNRGVLPLETTNYVPIILAMTIMEKNAAEYGLQDVPLDAPIEYDTIETTAPTSLSLVADLADAPLAEVQQLNPAILKDTAPDDYVVRVPKGSGEQVTASLQLIPAEHRTTWRIHRVAAGETLASIVKQYGLPVSSLMAANRMDKPEAMEGDRLIIPVTPRSVAAARPQNSARRSSTKHSAAVREPRQTALRKTHATGGLVARTSAQ
jgi:membrane-bound lytic murein transglycosylase D